MSKAPQKGFTLVELIIFIVVVSAGMAGILLVMNRIVVTSADPMIQKQSLALAESLLEEIMLKEYANPSDGYTGLDRTQFDDVSDYERYSTSTGMVDGSGTPIPGLGGYNISPAVSVVTTADLPGVIAKKITVSTTGPGGTVTLSGYRSVN